MKELKIGDKVEDGSVLAGIDPVTLKLFYARTADEYDHMNLSEAQAYLTATANSKYRLPTDDELTVMFNYQNQIGGFKGDWYLSSTQTKGNPHTRNFNGGNRCVDGTRSRFAVRLVLK